MIMKSTFYRHATSSEHFVPTFPSRGRPCFACLGWFSNCFSFLEDFYFKYPFGIFFSFQFFISFSKTENFSCGRFFFVTLFRCFCSKKRSFGNEMRNEIFLEKRGRKQLFFWDNTRENCCATAFFPIKNLTYILPQMRQNINAF